MKQKRETSKIIYEFKPHQRLEQDTLLLLLSTGWFQKQIRVWFT